MLCFHYSARLSTIMKAFISRVKNLKPPLVNRMQNVNLDTHVGFVVLYIDAADKKIFILILILFLQCLFLYMRL